MADQTWTHCGVAITLDGKGVFRATMPEGSKLSAQSLDAMKKRIEKLATFPEFDAYVQESGWSESRDAHKAVIVADKSNDDHTRYLKKVRIVGIDRVRKRFVTKDGGGFDPSRIWPATEETKKAWLDREDAEDRKRERIEQLDAEIRDADALLVPVEIKEFLK